MACCFAIASSTSLADAIEVSMPIPSMASARPTAEVSQFSTKLVLLMLLTMTLFMCMTRGNDTARVICDGAFTHMQLSASMTGKSHMIVQFLYCSS